MQDLGEELRRLDERVKLFDTVADKGYYKIDDSKPARRAASRRTCPNRWIGPR